MPRATSWRARSPWLLCGSWLLLVLLALGSTLHPFVATRYACRHATAANMALTACVAPLIGVIGGAILLGEIITPVIALGGLLTLSGVVLVGRTTRASR